MNIVRSTVTGFLLASVLVALPASAGEAIQHAAECVPLEGASVVYSSRGLATYSDRGVLLECGVPHGSNRYADQYTQISVWAYDRNPSTGLTGRVTAQECVQYWDGSGARCSSLAVSTGTGAVQLVVPRIFTTADRDDFTFIEVGLPAYHANGPSSMLGVWYQW